MTGRSSPTNLRANGDFSIAACQRLLKETRWPAQRKKRRSIQDPDMYQVLGQYSYGTFAGVTLSTYKLRYTTLYLNDFMTSHGAHGPRSSLSITRNARVKPHRDVNNRGLNYCMAFGSFKGGDLWVEEKSGNTILKVGPDDYRSGRILKHHNRMNVFDPKKYHAVDEWEGERWSITAFRSRSSEQMTASQSRHLEDFGFSLQGYEEHPLSRGSAVRQISQAIRCEGTGVKHFPSYGNSHLSPGDR